MGERPEITDAEHCKAEDEGMKQVIQPLQIHSKPHMKEIQGAAQKRVHWCTFLQLTTNNSTTVPQISIEKLGWDWP